MSMIVPALVTAGVLAGLYVTRQQWQTLAGVGGADVQNGLTQAGQKVVGVPLPVAIKNVSTGERGDILVTVSSYVSGSSPLRMTGNVVTIEDAAKALGAPLPSQQIQSQYARKAWYPAPGTVVSFDATNVTGLA